MRKNNLFRFMFVLLVALYPFFIYNYAGSVSPKWFSILLLMLFLVRSIFFQKVMNSGSWLDFLVVGVFCGWIFVFESETVLKLYPALMNFGVSALFFLSLRGGEQSLLEKLANLNHKKPPKEAKHYLRKLTLIWGIFLLMNGMASIYSAYFLTLYAWTAYNGVLAYVLMGVLVVGEWIFRGLYKKRHNIND